MRILLNGRPITGTRTGIGWYTLRLGAALQSDEQVEEVGAALGGRIWPLGEVAGPASVRQTSRHHALKNLVPIGLRRTILDLTSHRLHRHASHWSVFHETNYIAPRVPLPLVTTVYDLSYLRYPEYLPSHRREWLLRYLETSLRHSRAVISISRFTAEELMNCFPWLDESNVFTTPLGVDHSEFHPRRSPQEQHCVISKYGLPPSFMLYLGTLEPRKNLQGLLQAYALLPERCRREYPLILAGCDGWQQTYFQHAIGTLQQQGCLKLLGYVPQSDVPALMRAAAVFCFPSLYEGFGLPALEAAACGTPVLCAKGSSLPEVLGASAEYVDPHCAEDIADGLLRILENDEYRTTLAARGPERAADFTWSRCASATLEAYQRAA